MFGNINANLIKVRQNHLLKYKIKMTQDYDLIDNVERHQYECHIESLVPKIEYLMERYI
mgnify:CR=1 FL=1